MLDTIRVKFPISPIPEICPDTLIPSHHALTESMRQIPYRIEILMGCDS
jgi:hypothetical protein